jgi:dTDP-glucose 4,6-dehydratase
MTAVHPRSPYAASKCASDLMVYAYAQTYGLEAMITRCTNNYGPNQHEEKLIPKAISTLVLGQEMTLYGDGSHSRDWIFVDDHCAALETVMRQGLPGNTYCIGSGLELTNKEAVIAVAKAVREVMKKEIDLKIRYTDDRPTDDARYAVDTHKIQSIGFKPVPDMGYFMARIRQTVKWYLENEIRQ